MTTESAPTNARTPNGKGNPPGPLVRYLTGTMWRFWCFLLVLSLGVAAGIYYAWLRGNL